MQFYRLVVSLFLLFNLSIAYAFSNTACNLHQCIAVVDAGSTGSRLHIYSFDLDETNSPVHIQEVWNNKVSPGLATLQPDSATIHTYLDNLFINSPEKNLKVFFYATAGMRLLSANKQKLYYDQLNLWFKQHSEWQLQKAKTITGKEEAIFDWLAVNYYAGGFQKSQSQAIGVMDMGGASVQVVFPMKENSTYTNAIHLTLYGQKYNLFVHSFLGLGQTEVSHHFLDVASCFSNNYPMPDGDLAQGNASFCAQKINALINVHEVNELISPLLQANPIDSWYAIGGIANLAEHPLIHFDKQFTSQALLDEGNAQLCQQNWDSLSQQLPNDDYLHLACFSTAYYYSLLVNGYGIRPEQPINFISPSKNVDWTSGVVLLH